MAGARSGVASILVTQGHRAGRLGGRAANDNAGMLRHPDRVWRLEGASNFRDLGGYPGHGGRPVRWRRLFRSDHLGGLTEDDKAQLAALGLAKAFDFRGDVERAAASYELDGLTQHSLAIEPTVVQRMHELVDSGQALTPQRAAGL